MIKITDEWRTPKWLFDDLHNEFDFKYDLCANENNALCADYNTDLVRDYKPNIGSACFMNPPYSNPKYFVECALEISKRTTVVCLLKVDNSTKWWALFWDFEKHKPKPGVEVRFLPKRVKFDPPTGWEGKVSSPAFPSCIVIMNRRGYK